MKSKANGTGIKQNSNLQNQSYTKLYLKNALEEQGFESWPPSICGFEFRGNSCTRQKEASKQMILHAASARIWCDSAAT